MEDTTKNSTGRKGRLAADVAWGARWGLFGGALLAVVGAAIALLRGGQEERWGFYVVPVLVAFYLLAGLTAGIIVGAFRRRLVKRSGAVAAGIVAGFPASLMVLALFGPPLSEWGGDEVVVSVLSAILLGGMGGWQLWSVLGDPLDPLNAHISRDRAHGRDGSRGARAPRGRGRGGREGADRGPGDGSPARGKRS